MAFSAKLVVLVFAAQLMAVNALPHGGHGHSHQMQARAPKGGLGGIIKGVEHVAGLFLREDNPDEMLAREPKGGLGGIIKGVEHVAGLFLREDELDEMLAREPKGGLGGIIKGVEHVAGLFLREDELDEMLAREPKGGFGGITRGGVQHGGEMFGREDELDEMFARDDEFEAREPKGGLGGIIKGVEHVAGLFLREDELEEFLAREPGFSDDDMHLEARGQGSQCQPLTIDDAKRLPGWSLIEKYANDNYGGGKYTVVTNPPDYPDRAATVCAPLQPIQLKVDQSTKACTSNNLDVNGGVSGTNAQVGVKQRVGVSAETSMSVSKSSVFSTSLSFGVSIGVPSIGLGASTSTSMSSTISNKSTQSFKSSFNNMQEISVSYDNKKGKKCAAKISSKTCQATATGEVPLVASGYVWFNYDDAREGKHGGGKHYKWAVRIEDAIKNPAQRSSSIQFNGNFKATSNTQGKYDVACK
ncbi:hypothetical protein BJ165DRAFT_622015 [Panaeolus papilionaceus]|nr:hypothetical protein BJ165DRAFT_622015 [Panaeolus papilionaceus]